MKTYTIYYHTFPNGKMYFGQTCKKPESRWGDGGKGYKNQKFMWNAIQKYGWENIDHRIISIGLDKDEADFQEMFYISAYRTNEPEFGYNLTAGGQGAKGTTMSDETKKKHSERMKVNNPAYNYTDEWRKHISEAQKGIDRTTEYQRLLASSRMKENNPMKNPDIAKHVADLNRGKHLSDEHKKKIAIKSKEAQKRRKELGLHLKEYKRKKYKWLLPSGEIKEMDSRNAKIYHPDWILINE